MKNHHNHKKLRMYSLQSYRLDYLAYIICIMVLFACAHYMPLPAWFIYIPLLLAWLPLAWKAVADLQKKQIGNEFFLVFATIFSLIGKQETAIMIILIIMLLARYAELLIEHQTKRALETIIHLIPTEVTVRSGTEERNMPLDQVTPGMEIVVKTGGRIPVDGNIIEGVASINESALTGESLLKEKQTGDTVFAGTFIEAGSIIVATKKVKQETLFGKMTALLVQAEQNKAQITIITERIVRIFIPVYLLLIGSIWLLTHNFDIILTLLIFGSPLELALITPLTVLAGTVAAFRQGILVKGGRALEAFAHTDTMIFDKTGTLTEGEPHIITIASYDPKISNTHLLILAGMAEKHSDHVVAKALARKIAEEGLAVPTPDTYNSIVGHGVEIEYQGVHYFFGNTHFIQAAEHGNSTIPAYPPCQDEKSHSNFYLAAQGTVLGKICMADALRQDAKLTITKLFESGIKKIVLLSGDRQEITDTIAQQLNIPERHGTMFPDQKLLFIKNLQQEGHIVAMVGDGINDAAALQQAHVGIAMGAMGMEPAINAADIVLMTNELYKIVFVRKLAQKVFRVIKQNLVVGFLLLHALGLFLTLMQIVTPLQAAFAHAISDIFILLNASRLIHFHETLSK